MAKGPMNKDVQLKQFAGDLFSYIYRDYNSVFDLPVKLPHVFNQHAGNDFSEDVGKSVMSLCLSLRSVFNNCFVKFFPQFQKSVKHFMTFLTSQCLKLCGDDIFLSFIMVCAFISELNLFCWVNGYYAFMNTAPKCLAAIFNNQLKSKFYAEGSWEKLRQFCEGFMQTNKGYVDREQLPADDSNGDFINQSLLASIEEMLGQNSDESEEDGENDSSSESLDEGVEGDEDKDESDEEEENESEGEENESEDEESESGEEENGETPAKRRRLDVSGPNTSQLSKDSDDTTSSESESESEAEIEVESSDSEAEESDPSTLTSDSSETESESDEADAIDKPSNSDVVNNVRTDAVSGESLNSPLPTSGQNSPMPTSVQNSPMPTSGQNSPMPTSGQEQLLSVKPSISEDSPAVAVSNLLSEVVNSTLNCEPLNHVTSSPEKELTCLKPLSLEGLNGEPDLSVLRQLKTNDES